MADVVLLTPREISTGGPSINNQEVSISDGEYLRLDPSLRLFYEKVRENLGLACITGHLRHAGYSVRMTNLHGRSPSDEAIVELIRQERPRFVGISIMYDLHIIDALRLVRCVRRADPDVVVSIGGAFCTYNAKLIAGLAPEVDFVAFGEAENTVVGVMDAIDAGTDWRQVPGLYYRDNGEIRTSGMPVLVDLSQSVWPARDLLETHRAAGIPTRVASTFTSRGCHAKCTFCYAPRQPGITDGPWRLRPAVDVVDEIEYLQREFGTRFVWFNDDNFGGAFADGFGHAVEFAEAVVRRGLKFSFHAEFRVDSGLIDHSALDLLHRAGMKSALLGLESGSAGVLKRFKKGTTVAYNFDAARIFRNKGLELDPGWIMVEPQTSLDDLWENLQFIVASDVHQSNHTDNPFLLMNRAIALRGTEMFDAITDPLPPPEMADMDEAAYKVLLEARRDYRIPDTRVEALWSVWSDVAGELSDRRENRLPFLANTLAVTCRARGAEAGPAKAMLAALRRWRNDLPQLFAAYLNLGLVMADQNPSGVQGRFDSEVRAMVAEFDQIHLGMSFAEFEAAVDRAAGQPEPVAAG
ncbi:B12-binding domain-containing radical SAM protein [Plantactinospora sp. CA-290183]|uniref:B12-binding domain-containing radical SAM protein n=1 Tax=Plantactinospora sp. CA-290183 TaxID=3240006 RepID=UPI003D9213B9